MSGIIRDILYKFKPGIRKEYLLPVGGIVWLSAGVMLTARGSHYFYIYGFNSFTELAAASIIGAAFYFLLFIKISSRNILRIKSMKIERPCLFSFFDFKGYLLMIVMITAGITLRRLQIVNPDYLYTFYIGMGIPLIISSLRFFYF